MQEFLSLVQAVWSGRVAWYTICLEPKNHTSFVNCQNYMGDNLGSEFSHMPLLCGYYNKEYFCRILRAV
jgi:hypothetical protein